MSTPLSSSEQSQIQAVDDQLERYITQVQSGTANPKDLVQIHNALMSLATNPRIPLPVQQSLQMVLGGLKEAPGTTASLMSLQSAKSQVDSLLSDSVSDTKEKMGKGGLGGSSGESEG